MRPIQKGLKSIVPIYKSENFNSYLHTLLDNPDCSTFTAVRGGDLNENMA